MSEVSEQKVLEYLKENVPNSFGKFFLKPNELIASIEVGVPEQDDCAVINFGENLSQVITSDFVRGEGFKLFQKGYLTYEDLGYYLVIANLSDIAAMGAKPMAFTSALRWGPNLTMENFESILRGMILATEKYETQIIGGDVGSYSAMSLSGTAFGMCETNTVLKRKGAQIGDGVYIIGDAIGLPNAALTYFLKAKENGLSLSFEEEQVLLKTWKRPIPRIREGLLSASLNGSVHCCQDVSDGTKATVEQLSTASGVSFQLLRKNIPIHPIIQKIADFMGLDPLVIAFGPSVDFNLMITMDKHVETTLRNALGETPLFYIGNVIDPSISSHLLEDNKMFSIPGVPWRHGDILQTMQGKE